MKNAEFLSNLTFAYYLNYFNDQKNIVKFYYVQFIYCDWCLKYLWLPSY